MPITRLKSKLRKNEGNFNGNRPQLPLRAHQTNIEWSPCHQYLGIWMDGKLHLHQHVSETRNRIRARLKVMRFITATESGADLRVLKTYLQAIRTIIDYATPLLATIHPAQIEHLEKLQNEALRIMLGAPRWTKVCNMRVEAKIPRVKYRIHAMNPFLLGKKAAHPRYSNIIRNVRQSLAHNEELFRKETWASKTAQGIKSIQSEGSFLARTPDVPHPTYTHAPPCAKSSLHFFITPLTDKKDNLATTDLSRQAQRALAASNTDGADVYFTDGSVDDKQGSGSVRARGGDRTLPSP
ncbi:hypothetical protein O3P69_018966 [Scylla paramamosain]|uniref:Uncharacterized protein n=1 Tax=Scylla paramamosain TaxID=85552 RepID=A0AAW0S9F1_SCYPA